MPLGDSLCDKCKAQSPVRLDKRYDKARDPKIVKFRRSKEWHIMRSYIMQRDKYLCQHCKEKGLVVQAVSVHHIVSLQTDWSRRLDADNLVALCDKCHNRADKKGKHRVGGAKKVL